MERMQLTKTLTAAEQGLYENVKGLVDSMIEKFKCQHGETVLSLKIVN